MRQRDYDKIIKDYQESCRQKTEFAKDYIKKNSINCDKCNLEKCTFVSPPYECEVERVFIREELPPTILEMSEKDIFVNKKLRGMEIL